jgi:hypothetical protein
MATVMNGGYFAAVAAIRQAQVVNTFDAGNA